jgi:hypothetical protein
MVYGDGGSLAYITGDIWSRYPIGWGKRMLCFRTLADRSLTQVFLWEELEAHYEQRGETTPSTSFNGQALALCLGALLVLWLLAAHGWFLMAQALGYSVAWPLAWLFN